MSRILIKKHFPFRLRLLISFILAWSLDSEAQTITGILQLDNKIETSASVYLLPYIQDSISSIWVSGTFTEKNGQFTLSNIPPGKYIIRFKGLLFSSLDIGILEINPSSKLDLGKIIVPFEQRGGWYMRTKTKNFLGVKREKTTCKWESTSLSNKERLRRLSELNYLLREQKDFEVIQTSRGSMFSFL